MKYLALLLVVLCFSCKREEPKPKIEIYLLKTKVESYEGSRTLELAKFDTISEEVIEAGLAQTRYDTIKNEYIFAGKFKVTVNDLMDRPFITDGQILKLDVEKNEIRLDSLATMQVSMLEADMRYGTQLVITVDKKPVLAGYFWNGFSSYWCHTYHIMYHRNITVQDHSRSHQIFYEPIKNTEGINQPPYPTELIEAFRSSGRLRE